MAGLGQQFFMLVLSHFLATLLDDTAQSITPFATDLPRPRSRI
jgi:hypothetical protein